jgi:hypothetical protein
MVLNEGIAKKRLKKCFYLTDLLMKYDFFTTYFLVRMSQK